MGCKRGFRAIPVTLGFASQPPHPECPAVPQTCPCPWVIFPLRDEAGPQRPRGSGEGGRRTPASWGDLSRRCSWLKTLQKLLGGGEKAAGGDPPRSPRRPRGGGSAAGETIGEEKSIASRRAAGLDAALPVPAVLDGALAAGVQWGPPNPRAWLMLGDHRSSGLPSAFPWPTL